MKILLWLPFVFIQLMNNYERAFFPEVQLSHVFSGLQFIMFLNEK